MAPQTKKTKVKKIRIFIKRAMKHIFVSFFPNFEASIGKHYFRWDISWVIYFLYSSLQEISMVSEDFNYMHPHLCQEH